MSNNYTESLEASAGRWLRERRIHSAEINLAAILSEFHLSVMDQITRNNNSASYSTATGHTFAPNAPKPTLSCDSPYVAAKQVLTNRLQLAEAALRDQEIEWDGTRYAFTPRVP